MWFFLALLGYLFLAIVFILDKFLLSQKQAVGDPKVYTAYSTIFMAGALAALPFGGGALAGVDWLWAAISGITFGLGLYAMFIAVKAGEASHIDPFIGAMVTVATLFLAQVFLQEQLSGMQYTGVVVLLSASYLLVIKKDAGRSGFHSGLLWAIAAGVFFALSHVSAKYLYGAYDFVSVFVWTKASTALVGLALLCVPSVRQRFQKKKTPEKRERATWRTTAIIVVDKALGIAGVILIQYAIFSGSVTLVNAISGLQYVFMFLFIYLLTRFAPRIFRESFTRHELLTQSVALVLVLVGSALLVL